MVERLQRLLIHRRLPLIGMLLGLLLGLPTLWTGWFPSDDLLQRSFILSSPLPVVLTRLFVFLDPSINTLRMDAGYFPWWTYEQAHIIFFRPLAAFSLWLDYQFWPNSNLLMHLHSVLLYGILCLVAARLFRRLLGATPQAGLAAILFSLSTAHIGCVVSLAARNLILTTIFGVLTVLFHDRWRREGWRPGLFLALLTLLLSLFSAETGVATCAYLLAYAIFFDVRSWPGRILSISPYLLLTVAWLLAYQSFGFGAFGSEFYLSPLQEPLRFLVAIIERLPFLLMGQWILPDPAAYTVLSNGARFVLWILSVLVLVGIGFLLFPLILRDRAARFLTMGMLLSAIPVCAVSPASGRHLTFISLGAFGLLGGFITGRLQPLPWAPSSKTWRAAALWMSILFLSLHAVIYPVAGSFVRPSLNTYAVTVLDIGAQADLPSQDVFVVNAPSPSLFIYYPSYREFTGDPLPAHLRILAPGFSPVTFTTVDEYTVVLEPEGGFLVTPESLSLEGKTFLPLFHSSYSLQYGDGLYRAPAFPLEVGQQVELTGVTIEVLSLTEDGRPAAVRATFDLPLSDGSHTWLMWDWGNSRYVPFELPEIGSTVLIPGPY